MKCGMSESAHTASTVEIGDSDHSGLTLESIDGGMVSNGGLRNVKSLSLIVGGIDEEKDYDDFRFDEDDGYGFGLDGSHHSGEAEIVDLVPVSFDGGAGGLNRSNRSSSMVSLASINEGLTSDDVGMRKSTSMACFVPNSSEPTRRRSSLKSSQSSCGMRRSSSNVSFGSVGVREFERVVDEHPDDGSAALAIGWDYDQHDHVELDAYEDTITQKKDEVKATKKKKHYDIPLSPFERNYKFLTYGFTPDEYKTKAQREREEKAKKAAEFRAEMAQLAAEAKKKKKISYKLKKAVGRLST